MGVNGVRSETLASKNQLLAPPAAQRNMYLLFMINKLLASLFINKLE